jgi:hypothetical protein
MYAFITKNSQLLIFQCHIHQDAIPVFGSLHAHFSKNLHGPVKRIDKTAAAFNKHSYFPAGIFFSFLDGRDNYLLLFISEKFSLSSEK